MQEQFVPYSLAVRLKELGYSQIRIQNHNKSILGYYYEEKFIPNRGLRLHHNVKEELLISAPLWQQAFDWFREKHNLHSTIIYISKTSIDSGGYMIMIDYINPHKAILDYDSYKTHKEARQALLNKLIKIVENEKV